MGIRGRVRTRLGMRFSGKEQEMRCDAMRSHLIGGHLERYKFHELWEKGHRYLKQYRAQNG